MRDDETISVVEDISMVYNQENDEAKYQISYIQNGTLHTAMVEDNVLCTYEGFSQSTYWTTGDLPNIPSNKNEIKKGDIIKFALNSQGEISKICLMYDAENHVVCYDVVSTSNRVCSVQPAKINIIDDTFCEMTFVNRGDIERGNLKNCRVIIVDETVRNVLVTVGTLEDISKDDLVVFYARYNENRVAVVYKGYIG